MTFNPSPPIKEGDEFKVKIECLGSKGDGLVHIAGFTVFVSNTQIDQEVEIKIVKVCTSFAFAEVINP